MPQHPQYDHVFQLLPNPSVLLLPDAPKFTIVAVNKAYLETMISLEEDLIGKGIFEAFPDNPDDLISKGSSNLMNSLEQVISKKESHKIPLQKYNMLLPGTSKFKVGYFNVQNIPVKDDNKINYILHSVEDVTEKVESRKKIEETEKRYRKLIENLPVATYSCDAEGHVLVYNKAAAVLWEREPEIEKDLWCGSWKIYNEDGNPIPFDKSPMAIALKEGRAITDQEIIVERPNGDKLNVVPYPVPFLDSSGRITGAVNVLIDITNRKKEQEKLWKLNKELSDYKYALDESSIVAITDQKGIIKHVNDNFCKISKFSREELIGQNHRIINSGYHSKEYFLNMWKTISKGKIWKGELKNKAKDGSTYWVDTIITPFLDERGNPYQYVATRFDINERKKAELNLIQSEKRLKEAHKVAHLGNWDLNFETGISLWSNEACKIYGLSPKDKKQTYSFWLSFIHPEDMDAVLKLIDESNKTLSDLILNYRIILKDGTIKFIYGISKFEFDNNQKPIGLYGITQDVTETTKAEEKVRFQSNLLNTISQAAISVNANGIINFWNKAATEIYGWTAEEALGKNVISLISTEQKEEDTKEIMEELSKGNSSNEFVVKHKDGHTFSVFASTSPFYGKQGKFEGAIEVSLDITGRKKEEEKLAKLNKELSDYKYALDESSIVAITDQKGTIKHVNDNFCKITQFSPEELIGQNHRIINSGYHSKEFFRNMWKTISSGKIWKGKVKNKAKDGSTYWVDTIITPLLDEREKPYQYVVTRFDITEGKKAKENIKKRNEELVIQYEEKKIRAAELSLSNKKLVKTNTELDRFVYSVSHDLRSPLTSILGLISFIEEDSREPNTLEQVKMIRASINRLDGFIKNILSYSQNNHIGLERKKIPVKKTINEIVNSVRNIKEAKGISFQVDIDEKQPFYSNWQRFNTILENLISNAIKYHTKEVFGRYIKVTGTTDNEELKLSISDNGIGIDAAYHDKIFDMFYRLSSKTPGSGFGLYIVKETLEKMHGRIEVQSEKGVGTTFIITLKNLKI
ncbi:MAG TPA: PAS domain S-box protein [Gillisia sp.]|nr:PAS domain S-box protein [Gillisia sp.]